MREKLFAEHVKRYFGNENEEKMLNDLREEEKKSRANRGKLQSICQRLKVVVVYVFLFHQIFMMFAVLLQSERRVVELVSATCLLGNKAPKKHRSGGDWRAVDDTVSDLTVPRIKPQIFGADSDVIAPIDRLLFYFERPNSVAPMT